MIWDQLEKEGEPDKKELGRALKEQVMSRKLSKLICYYCSEWGLDYSNLESEVTAFFDRHIEEARGTVKEKLEERKKDCLEKLEVKVKKLDFWKEVKVDTVEKKEVPSNTIYDFTTNQYRPKNFWEMEEDNSSAKDEEKEKQSLLPFPTSPKVYYFHPIAFVEQMKMILGQGGDCPVLVWGKKVSCEFRKRVVQISKRLECDPNHLMTAMALETGGKFSPSIDNGLGKDADGIGYVGLIQFGNSAVKELNKKYFLHKAKIKKSNLKAMSTEEQLCYVEYFLARHKGKLKTLADFYLAILWPAAVGKGNQKDYVIFEQGKSTDKAYYQNPTFHREKGEYKENSKGVIYERHGKEGGKTYVWEIAETIQEWYDKGVLEKNNANNCTCNNDYIDLTDKVNWMSQFNRSEIKNGKMQTDGCWRTSQKLLINSGLGKQSGYKTGMIITALENNKHTSISLTAKAKEGVEYIDSQLEQGAPVLVGVNHTINYRHGGKIINKDLSLGDPGTTDHYIVIVGRVRKNNKTYYRFYEVGTSWAHIGQHSNNKLYLGSDFSLKGYRENGSKEYTVSQVRKNVQ